MPEAPTLSPPELQEPELHSSETQLTTEQVQASRVARLTEKFNIVKHVGDRIDSFRSRISSLMEERETDWKLTRMLKRTARNMLGMNTAEQEEQTEQTEVQKSPDEHMRDEITALKKELKEAGDDPDRELNAYEKIMDPSLQEMSGKVFNLLNKARGTISLPSFSKGGNNLSVLTKLTARLNAAKKTTEHRAPYVNNTGVGTVVGQNNGEGFESAEELVAALWNSPTHGPYVRGDFRTVDIAIWIDDDSKFHAVVHYMDGHPKNDEGEKPELQLPENPDEFTPFEDLTECRTKNKTMNKLLTELENKELFRASPKIELTDNPKRTAELGDEITFTGAICVDLTNNQKTVTYALLDRPPRFERPDGDDYVRLSFSQVVADFNATQSNRDTSFSDLYGGEAAARGGDEDDEEEAPDAAEDKEAETAPAPEEGAPSAEQAEDQSEEPEVKAPENKTDEQKKD